MSRGGQADVTQCAVRELPRTERRIPPDITVEPFELHALTGIVAMNEVVKERGGEPNRFDDSAMVFRIALLEMAQKRGQVSAVFPEAQIVANRHRVPHRRLPARVLEVEDAPALDFGNEGGLEKRPEGIHWTGAIRYPRPALHTWPQHLTWSRSCTLPPRADPRASSRSLRITRVSPAGSAVSSYRHRPPSRTARAYIAAVRFRPAEQQTHRDRLPS